MQPETAVAFNDPGWKGAVCEPEYVFELVTDVLSVVCTSIHMPR
jgi:hypothetical protein